MMAIDRAHNQVVLFGGSSFTTTFGDTWTWNGSAWTLQHPASSPAARFSAAMATEPTTGRPVLFGGQTSTMGLPTDTWTWDGTTWTKQSPATSPPFRTRPAMAVDRASGTVVLFGGENGAAGRLLYGDTWTWDGHTWTQQNPPTSPAGRAGASMVTDPATGHVVLFGGGNSAVDFGDTWIWDGHTWTQLQPASAPSAREDAMMANDAASRTGVLFGGAQRCTTVCPILSDTWTWDGANWTMRNPTPSPSIRELAGMAPDTLGRVVLFGGLNNTADLGDTWTLAPEVSAMPGSGLPGAAVTVNGLGFSARKKVAVAYDSALQGSSGVLTTVCTATVRSNGSFRCAGHIPTGTNAGPTGPHDVTATDTGAMQSANTFVLT